MAICDRMELRVYDRLAATHIATLPGTSPAFTKGAGGTGLLSATFALDVADMYYGNYIPNSTFETNITGWVGNTYFGELDMPTAVDRVSHTSGWRLRATWPLTTSGSIVLTPIDGLIAGRSYSAYMDVYVPAGHSDVRIEIPFVAESAWCTVKNAWTRISVNFVAAIPEGGTFVGVRVGPTTTSAQYAYIDNVMVCERAQAPDFLSASPILLSTVMDDCVIKVAVPLTDGAPLTEVAAYAVRAPSGTLWEGAGGRTRAISGAPTLWDAWSKDAIVYPEVGTFGAKTGSERTFGWQSSICAVGGGAFSVWEAPSASTGQQNATTGARAGKPAGWPSALGTAKWLTRGTTNNGDRRLFAADVTVAAGWWTVWFSSDESATVYLAGEQIIATTSEETGYQDLSKWQGYLPAGTYRVAVDTTVVAQTGGSGGDPILFAMAATDADGVPTTVARISDTTNWLVCTLHPETGVAPGLTIGEILTALLDEADTRGVSTWSALTATFTDADDSDGVPWATREEQVFRLAFDTYGDVVSTLSAVRGVQVDITPALDLVASQAGGVDRTSGAAYYDADTSYLSGSYTGAGVVLEALVNVDRVTATGVAADATAMPVQTAAGWVEVTDSAAITARGRREQGLSMGSAPSLSSGRDAGLRALSQQSAPTSEWTVEFYAIEGAVPFLDFWVGDTVTVRVDGVDTPRVITHLAAEAASTASVIRWTAVTSPPEVGQRRVALTGMSRIWQALRSGTVSINPAARAITTRLGINRKA